MGSFVNSKYNSISKYFLCNIFYIIGMETKQGTGKTCANNGKDGIIFKRKTQYVVVTLVRLITLNKFISVILIEIYVIWQ